MATISEALAIAVQHHQAGRLQVAEQMYRQILQLEPQQVDAIHLLGVIASQVGKHEVAVELIRRAIGLKGTEAVFHKNLAGAYRALGRLPEAVASCRRALDLKPDYAEALNHLGHLLEKQGKMDEAIASFRQAVQINPEDAEVQDNLRKALASVSREVKTMEISQSCILITAADARFFDLVRGCIESIRDKPQGQRMRVAFFDLGCTEEQRAWLRTKVDFLREPEWEFSFPSREQAPAYQKGLLARPFLRRYFPDYEVYLWIDADAWVQDWQAIELLMEGARRRRGLAVVPEVDRASRLQYGGLPNWWSEVAGWYSACYGAEVGRKFCSFPLLNAGVFALHQDAPHWKAWEEAIGEALQRSCDLLTDQMALNWIVYGKGLFDQTEFLPCWCNWTCHFGLPAWDEKHGRLVEPYLPNTSIGIMHLTHKKYERSVLRSIEGRDVDVRLRYPCRALPAPPASTSTIPPSDSHV